MLPHPLVLPLRLIPDAVHTEIFARLFNHLLRGQPLAVRLAEINGKSVRILIRDAASELCFRIEHGLLQSSPPGRGDIRITGTVDDFWKLATRREDPDTLFFSRRLCIEGDIETGVHIKNLLDALDYNWESHFHEVLGPVLGTAVFELVDRTIIRRSSTPESGIPHQNL
jgi:O2-independent ubiquinone biosynthesis accessory factor UbiT